MPTDPQQGLLSWLPWVLESLPLALVQVPSKPTAADPYDELFLLGQADRNQAMQGNPPQGGLPGGLKQWIRTGETSPHAVHISGDTWEERKDSLLVFLRHAQKYLADATESDGPPAASNIWSRDFGSELFGQILGSYKELIEETEKYDERAFG